MANTKDRVRRDMDELTAGLPSKSAKMRRLADAGYERADIARYLGVRYQFVYNVLAAPRPAAEAGEVSNDAPAANGAPRADGTDAESAGESAPKWVWITVGKGGRIELPVDFLAALAVAEGEQVQLALEDNGVRIMSRVRALRELQDHARRYVPEGVSLVDELLAERRSEAANEGEDD